MQTKLAGLVFMSIVCGVPAAYAAESPRGLDTTGGESLQTTAFDARLGTSTSQPPSSHAESLRTRTDPDCDGQMPPSSPVIALLSRLVRASTAARGAQCPIPPVPDNLPSQEPHP
jgi:hypothetical protein